MTGLFWWWPEANEYGIDWQKAVTSGWYNSTLFDNQTGRAYSSLSELKNFVGDPTAIHSATTATRGAGNHCCYDLSGRAVGQQPNYLYIRGGKKYVAR